MPRETIEELHFSRREKHSLWKIWFELYALPENFSGTKIVLFL